MKIPGSDGSTDAVKRVQDGRVGDSAVNRKGVALKAPLDGSGSLSETAGSQMDTVNFSSLGVGLGQELDPTKMSEDRKARLAKIAEQVRNGTYAPPAEAVASATAEEISLEIMLSGGALKQD